MLEQVRNSRWFRFTSLLLLTTGVGLLTSCASKRPPPLISDGTTGAESALPWNQQQKWEGQGQFAGMAEYNEGRR
ncbi:MAG TPA: hypothetical protein VF551_10150 [Chthoniobacterales bacterium]